MKRGGELGGGRGGGLGLGEGGLPGVLSFMFQKKGFRTDEDFFFTGIVGFLGHFKLVTGFLFHSFSFSINWRMWFFLGGGFLYFL